MMKCLHVYKNMLDHNVISIVNVDWNRTISKKDWDVIDTRFENIEARKIGILIFRFFFFFVLSNPYNTITYRSLSRIHQIMISILEYLIMPPNDHAKMAQLVYELLRTVHQQACFFIIQVSQRWP